MILASEIHDAVKESIFIKDGYVFVGTEVVLSKPVDIEQSPGRLSNAFSESDQSPLRLA